MMKDERDKHPTDERGNPVNSPYGPQDHVDQAAGGADNAPYETLSSEEKHRLAQKPREERRSEADTGCRKPTENSQ